MPSNFDPQVGKPDSPITKTHIRITKNDDTPADPNAVHITVDTEEAKETVLDMQSIDTHHRLCFEQEATLETLLRAAEETDIYLSATLTCGYSSQLAMAIDPTNSLGVPTFEDLPVVGDVLSAETIYVAESLTDFLTSIWTKIKQCFKDTATYLSSIMDKLFSDPDRSAKYTRTLQEKLESCVGRPTEDSAADTVPFSVWDKYSASVYQSVDICRGLNEMTRMVSAVTTNEYKNYLLAVVGKYKFTGRSQNEDKLPMSSETLTAFIGYHVIRLLHGSKLKVFGIELQKDKSPTIITQYANHNLPKQNLTLSAAGWTAEKALQVVPRVMRLCTFSNSLSSGFSRMMDETEESIKHTESVIHALQLGEEEDTDRYNTRALMRLKLEGLRVSRAIALQIVSVAMDTWNVWCQHSRRIVAATV